MKKYMKFLLTLVLAFGILTGCAKNEFKGGTFTGEEKGFSSTIKVEVTISNDKTIEAINIVESAESADIGEVALPIMIEKVLGSQSVDVDAVSTATITSDAFLVAVTKAIESSGLKVSDLKAKEAGAVEKKEETLDADVVIIGAGGAGMTAAITAASEGKSVIIIEKAPIVGGNTSRATGGMNAAETKYQETAGIEDSVELFVEDTMKGGYEKNNKELVQTMAEQSASAIEFLDSIGAHLSDVGKAGGASTNRSHRPVDAEGKILSVGSYLVPIFEQAAKDNNVTFYMETEATEIMMNEGAAVGVKASSANTDYTINAKAVILATGGFGGNLEMVESYKPELKGYVTTNASTITGDGIKMAEAVGANLVDMAEIQIHPTVVQSNGALITESLRGDGAILVNNEGKRFTNEVLTRDVVSANIIAEEGSAAWLIVDQQMFDDSNVIQGYVNKGYMIQGDTIADLAKAMEVDEATLQETIDNWVGMVKAGEDTDFGRDDLATVKYDLSKAPYYAVKIAPGVHHTMGGVEINTNTEVINKNGEVIPGLYAAGEVTGGVHGGNRLGGNAVADIIVFGRIAGQNAATYVSK
ncbi:flavocytochrome c [Anaerorhabdus furcosa]|uniref:Urocanate reductase n=1 Tax=Anaerorhabdus furcosa TaxID=118967 RepID=A0A1T4P820_9FIRM|nr:flavocytochrome c [Anaerorhabdus furcosa]SJZ87693.1 fumarate reductase flavoprotein subunit [Anaerorhabdus furcosa]